MSQDLQLSIISKKLSLIAALQLSPQAKELNKSEQVAMLTKFDLASDEIASILGTSKGTVDVLKSRLKKQGKGNEDGTRKRIPRNRN
jgi:DNA-binding CsgD family transcriptional regulator